MGPRLLVRHLSQLRCLSSIRSDPLPVTAVTDSDLRTMDTGTGIRRLVARRDSRRGMQRHPGATPLISCGLLLRMYNPPRAFALMWGRAVAPRWRGNMAGTQIGVHALTAFSACISSGPDISCGRSATRIVCSALNVSTNPALGAFFPSTRF
jgi:hypothetical protein